MVAATPDLTWTETPGPAATHLADVLGLPRGVTRTAAGATVAGRDLIGAETDGPGGRTRVLAATDPAADAGDALLVVAVEFTPHP